MNACYFDKVNIIKYLIEHDINIFIQNNEGDSTLNIAKRNGNEIIIKYLIEYTNRQNNIGDAFLTLVCKNGNKTEVEKLIMFFESNLNIKNNKNDTPLIIACKNGHYELITFLITNNQNKVDLNMDNDGDNPLITACKMKYNIIVI